MKTKKKPLICGSKLRGKAGKTCHRTAIKGKRRCYLHGGSSLSGTASPSFKHGRYSSYMPRDLQRKYIAHCRDTKSIDLHDEIGLITSGIAELVQALHQDNSLSVFPSMKKALQEFNALMEAGDYRKMKEVLDVMNLMIEKGSEREGIWDKIQDRVEARRKLVDTQRKYDIDMGRMLPVEQAHQFMISLALIVKDAAEKLITDDLLVRTLLGQVNRQFQTLFAEPVRALPSPDS